MVPRSRGAVDLFMCRQCLKLLPALTRSCESPSNTPSTSNPEPPRKKQKTNEEPVEALSMTQTPMKTNVKRRSLLLDRKLMDQAGLHNPYDPNCYTPAIDRRRHAPPATALRHANAKNQVGKTRLSGTTTRAATQQMEQDKQQVFEGSGIAIISIERLKDRLNVLKTPCPQPLCVGILEVCSYSKVRGGSATLESQCCTCGYTDGGWSFTDTIKSTTGGPLGIHDEQTLRLTTAIYISGDLSYQQYSRTLWLIGNTQR